MGVFLEGLVLQETEEEVYRSRTRIHLKQLLKSVVGCCYTVDGSGEKEREGIKSSLIDLRFLLFEMVIIRGCLRERRLRLMQLMLFYLMLLLSLRIKTTPPAADGLVVGTVTDVVVEGVAGCC